MQNSFETDRKETGFHGNTTPSLKLLSYLLLCKLNLIQLLHALLIVLLLQLADENLLLLVVPWILLGCILLELHGSLRV